MLTHPQRMIEDISHNIKVRNDTSLFSKLTFLFGVYSVLFVVSPLL